jgi:hypothetical protein
MTIRSLQVKLESGARTRSPSLTFCTPADDGWKRGAQCIEAICEQQVARVDRGKFDADEDLVRAGSFGLANVDILKSLGRVAVSCELNSAHIDLSYDVLSTPRF